MIKHNLLRSFLLLGALSFLLVVQQSCLKEYGDMNNLEEDLDYSASFAGAIANSKLTLRDLFKDYDKDELFSEDETGLLFLHYNKEVFSKAASEFIRIPNKKFGPMQNFYTDNAYNAITNPDAQNYKVFPTVDVPYTFLIANSNNGEIIDSIFLKKLDLTINVESDFPREGVLEVSFPMLRKSDGSLFTKNFDLSASGSVLSDSQHLTDCTLIMDHSAGAPANQIVFRFNLKLKNGADLNSGEKVAINISMRNMKYKVIYGYLGQMDIDVSPDTINISFFEDGFDGAVYFRDPSMTMEFRNSLGLPTRAYFDSLHTYSVQTDQTMSYPFPGNDSLDINYPLVPGETAEQKVVLDAQNFPGISDILNMQPKHVFFNVNAKTNPDQDLTKANFVESSSKFSLDLQMKLPLDGNALYSMVDTMALDIAASYDDISEHFVEANMRAIFNNFMPTNIYIQVIFTDDNFIPLDTLFKGEYDLGERLIESALLDANGRATQAVKKTNNVLFGNGSKYEHDINKLKDVKNAIIIGTLRTNEAGTVGNNSPFVRFYTDNYLDVKFGVKGSIKAEGEL